MIENSLKPFNKDAGPDRLFNICPGKSCKIDTEDVLLNVVAISSEARKIFIMKCDSIDDARLQMFPEEWSSLPKQVAKMRQFGK